MTLMGGPVAWILLGLAIIAVITYFERFFDLRRARIDYQDFLKGVINILASGNDAEALSVCEDTGAPAANVIATAIRHRSGSQSALRDAVDAQGRAEVGRLDRRLAVLAVIAQISPLIGLLGTIVGFIRVIWRANTLELASRADVFAPAMDALVYAASGICLAIVASVMYNSLRIRLDRIVTDLETAASEILSYLSQPDGGEKGANP